MEKKIAIIGGGDNEGAIAAALAKLYQNEIVVINPDNIMNEKDSYIEYRERPPIPQLFQSKEFICKGKHEYREVKGEWVCQCGRKTTD